MGKDKVLVGDVVEVISDRHKWAKGCFLVVDGVYDWGVTGYFLKPILAHASPAKTYYSVSWSELHLVGPSHKKRPLEV